MLWAACCTGFFKFLRGGEFTVRSTREFDPTAALMLENIAVDWHDNPAMVRIRLKSSKTDPFRHGVDVFLGQTHRDLCPVSALLAYPVVVGPLLVFKDGLFLTRDRLVEAVRSALQMAGVDTNRFTGHRFCIGAATFAAHICIQDSTIKMLGRWESSAHQQYIRTTRDTLAAFSAQLAQAE